MRGGAAALLIMPLLACAACDGDNAREAIPPLPAVAPDPEAARATVVAYLSDDPVEGRERWCDPAAAEEIEPRLADLAPYRPNVSEALAEEGGFAGVSLQLLRADGKN